MNKQWSDKANQVLEEKAENLSVDITRQLAQSRQSALAQMERQRSNKTVWLAPAFATMLVAVLFFNASPLKQAPESVWQVEDFELLMAEEDFEFYEQLAVIENVSMEQI